jgi:hypothetical protein
MSTETSQFQKTRLSNGRQPFFLKVDQRSSRARRWKELHRQFLAELCDGDVDRLAESQKHILNSLCDCALQLEVMRSCVANGQHVDPAMINKLARTLRLLSAKLGLDA